MYEILLVSFLVVAVCLVMLILIQHGKGADMGASFGAGASATVFGSAGSGNFLTRTTAVLAALFFAIALALAFMTTHKNKGVQDTASKIEKTATLVEPKKPINNGIPAVGTDVTSDKADIEATKANVDASKLNTSSKKIEDPVANKKQADENNSDQPDNQ